MTAHEVHKMKFNPLGQLATLSAADD